MEQQYKGPVTDRRIRELFADAGDFNYRTVESCGFPVHTYAIDGLTSGGDISDFVIRPLLENLQGNSMQELYQRALQTVVYNSVADVCPDLDTAARKLVNGFCVVLFEGTGAIAFEDKTEEKRSPSRPEVENTVKGPKDAFTETIRTNTSLIRRHLRTPELQLYETVVGRRSLTNVAIVSIRGLTSKELVRRLKQRLAEIDIDGMVSPASVEEYVTGSRATPFPLIQYTERTDKFCQGLLDGRVGLLVDGLPQGYLLPVNIGYLMQTPEDRGVDYISGTCVRCIRYLALLISLLLPAVYVAMTMFHPEMIPDALLQSIIESKKAVPFATVLEVLGLLIAFELLQEAGISLPQSIGQTISIIGGLVVGSAAVEARLVSPAALVAVAIAGICGYALPGKDLSDAMRLWRFLLAVCASIAGLFGVICGAIALLIHLAGLTSFGVAYLQPFSSVRGSRALLRPRLGRQKYRDAALHPQDSKNQR